MDVGGSMREVRGFRLSPLATHLHFANLLGWAAMLPLAWGISYNRKKFPWRTVLWGLGL